LEDGVRIGTFLVAVGTLTLTLEPKENDVDVDADVDGVDDGVDAGAGADAGEENGFGAALAVGE